MKTLRALVAKDLRRRLRAPAHLALTLAFPLALLAIIGIAFGGGGGGGGVSIFPIPMVVENRDDSFLGNLVGGALENERMAEYFDVTVVEEGTGEEIVRDGDAAALLVVPAGFTDSLLNGRTTTLTMVKDPGGVILPGIAEGFGEMLALILSAGARVLHEPLCDLRGMLDTEGFPADEAVAGIATMINRGFRKADRLLLPPSISIESVKETIEEEEEEEDSGFNIFGYLFPGIVVLGLLFVGQISMRDLMRERQEGHLRRLLSSPATMGSIVLSKLVSTLFLLVLCHFLLAAIAGTIFGIRWGNPLASLLLVLAEGVAITGLLAFLFAITRTERQADGVSSVIILSMSLLGGSMVPVDFFPDALQTAGRLTVNYWAIEGFREVMIREGTVLSIVPHLLGLTAFGAVLASIAAALLPRNLRRGD